MPVKIDEIVMPVPTGQQVGNCLAQISDIADKNRADGDPALVYKDEQVTILDPFLLFYLNRSGWPD